MREPGPTCPENGIALDSRTLRSGMKFLDPDGTVALEIVVKAHHSADLATVACISSHVRAPTDLIFLIVVLSQHSIQQLET